MYSLTSIRLRLFSAPNILLFSPLILIIISIKAFNNNRRINRINQNTLRLSTCKKMQNTTPSGNTLRVFSYPSTNTDKSQPKTFFLDTSMWVQFFKEASIPAQYVQSYAHKFTENRIRFDMLPDLDRQLLNELGISAIGDCLSILKHAKTWTPTVNTYNRPFFILNLETSFQRYSLQCFTCRFIE